MEERLKKELEKCIKENIKFGNIFGAIAVVAWICWSAYVIITSNTSSRAELVFMSASTVIVAISIIIYFSKHVLTCYKDLKAPESERYESLIIRVIRKKRRLGEGGGLESRIVAKNLETGEEIQFVSEDMKENETYYMLRAKHSKLFVYEPFEIDIPRE